MEIRLRVSSYDFLSMPIPLPPLSELEAIVKYLDAETGRIDKAIAAEEKMIALLQERREIVINEAVSGKCGSDGVDFNAEAQRRRGWEVVQLKRVAKICTGSTPDKNRHDYYSTSSGMLWIKPENLDSVVSIVETAEYLTEKGVSQGRVFPAYSIFVCCIASVGKVGFSDKEASCNQQINALIFNDKVYWKFGYYATVAAKEQYVSMASGNVVKILNTANQGKIEFPLPPLSEQEEIVKYLDVETGKIDRAIEVKRRQIELLRERRQIVIDEVVTGKVRVA
jgi:type I restriction enzyme S subunit